MSDFLFVPLVGAILGLHLLCMNLAVAGPLVCIWLEVREWRGHASATSVARSLSLASGMFLGVGIVFGFLLAWLQFGSELETLSHLLIKLDSRIRWAWWELLFSGCLLVVYAIWRRRSAVACSAVARLTRMLLAFAATTNLLYHFPPLLAVFARAKQVALVSEVTLTSAEIRSQFWEPEIASRWVHFAFASLASSGIALIVIALRRARYGESKLADELATTGARLTLVTSLAQFPVGLWMTLSLPALAQARLVGSDWGSEPRGILAPVLFGASILFLLALLYQLAIAAFGGATRGQNRSIVALFVVVVVLMSGTLLSLQMTSRSAAVSFDGAANINRCARFCTQSSEFGRSRHAIRRETLHNAQPLPGHVNCT